jgi:tetratricopeptide (TPR) repeat protein
VRVKIGTKINVKRQSLTKIAVILGTALVVVGCATARPTRSVSTIDVTALLDEADVLVRAGCFDCLRDAFVKYEALRTSNGGANGAVERATAGSVQAAGLLALRQRELGMLDDGYLLIAKDLLPAEEPLSEVLDIIGALPAGSGGIGRPPASDAQLAARQLFLRSRASWQSVLRDVAARDALTASVWLSVACGSRELGIEAVFEPIPATLLETPLLAYKRATCDGIQPEQLQKLMTQDPRFVEVTYLLGLSALGGRRVDEANEWFQHAYAWHPEWPSLTSYIGDSAVAAEEFQRAVLFYERTLALEPHAADALLGKVRALSYLGRHEVALAAVDQLLTERWFVGDGHYWRAFNESPLGQNDEAWVDVEEAAKLLINAEVPKLAGIIAYRLKRLDVARTKLDESRERNRADCETGFYLGIVLAEQSAWDRTVDVFVETAQCFEATERELMREIGIIRASDDPPSRKQRQIVRREKRIANGRRRLATAWFNTAAAYYNLARYSDARPFAEKVTGDEQFGERARELLALLK